MLRAASNEAEAQKAAEEFLFFHLPQKTVFMLVEQSRLGCLQPASPAGNVAERVGPCRLSALNLNTWGFPRAETYPVRTSREGEVFLMQQGNWWIAKPTASWGGFSSLPTSNPFPPGASSFFFARASPSSWMLQCLNSRWPPASSPWAVPWQPPTLCHVMQQFSWDRSHPLQVQVQLLLQRNGTGDALWMLATRCLIFFPSCFY